MIDVLVVGAVIGAPIEARIFKGAGAEDEGEEFHWPFGLKGEVRKEAVIAKGDAHGRCGNHESKHEPLKPVLLELNNIPRHGCNSEEKGTNEECAGDPVDPLERNTEF